MASALLASPATVLSSARVARYLNRCRAPGSDSSLLLLLLLEPFPPASACGLASTGSRSALYTGLACETQQHRLAPVD
jgi:hypothetical protein